jgi:acetyltransferase-like isoleucine patch superfamily enzyme
MRRPRLPEDDVYLQGKLDALTKYYKMGIKIGEGTSIGEEVRLGLGVSIGRYCEISDLSELCIFCTIHDRVYLGKAAFIGKDSDVGYVTHKSGTQVNLGVFFDAVGSYGTLHVFGTKGNLSVTCWDTYTAFRNQLVAFVEMLRTGERPYPLSETIENESTSPPEIRRVS